MSTVGRGGEGDVGQRIRDEILVIQVHMYFQLLSGPFTDRGEGILFFPFSEEHIEKNSFPNFRGKMTARVA